MKKLMIAAAIVCAAVMAQAGSVKWATSTAVIAAGKTGDTDFATGTLQLFCVAKDTSFDTVFAMAKNGSFTEVKSGTLSSGKITTVTFDYSPNGDYDWYAYLKSGDNFFISSAKYASVGTVGTANVGMYLKSQSNSGVINDVSKGANGAGWYGAVPEPTSGLLLLLGVAGLALKRKRA